MRYIVLAVIAFIAGLIAWLALRPECLGTLIRDEAECRRNFDAAFCASFSARADNAARNAATTFRTQSECLQNFEACLEHASLPAFVARPSAYCVSTPKGGGALQVGPVYRRIGQAAR